MLRLKFLKTLALCLPLLVGLLFCVVSCGGEAAVQKNPCGDEEKEIWDPCHYKNSCGFDVYVKKLKEGCFVLALEDYEKVPEFTKVLSTDDVWKTVQLRDKEYRLYYVQNASEAQVKKLSLDVAGTKLRIFEAHAPCARFLSLDCYQGLAIEDQIITIRLVRAEKRKGGVYSR